MSPPAGIPPQYEQLVRDTEQAEAALRAHGVAAEVSLETAADLARQALAAWFKHCSEELNALRVRTNIIYGLVHAYSKRPNWRRAINVASISVDMITPEPRTKNPDTLRLYALASANCVVLRILEGTEHLRGAAWEQVCIALEYFGAIEPDGIGHWKGVAYTAGAFMGRHWQIGYMNEAAVQKYAISALELLNEGSELRYLAAHLLGQGNGLVPNTGVWGSSFMGRRAAFGIQDLYHFDPALQS